MLRRYETGLENGEHALHIALEQRSAVEPQARKDARAMDAVGVGRHELVAAIGADVPAEFVLVEQEAKILLDAAHFVNVFLHVEIVRPTGVTNLSNKLGWTMQIPIHVPG